MLMAAHVHGKQSLHHHGVSNQVLNMTATIYSRFNYQKLDSTLFYIKADTPTLTSLREAQS